MELEGLKRCFAFVSEENLEVKSLVTDRHSQIKKFLKDHHPEINHMFDVWHVAKGNFSEQEGNSIIVFHLFNLQ